MRRRNNQDSYSVHIADTKSIWEKFGHLFVVADGMGAHAAGELASRLATDLIPHHYLKSQRNLPAEALAHSVTESNSEIFRRGQANPEFRNMGTTTSVLAMLPEGAVIAHVGDSRAYRLRGNTLEQLTFDHSLVWEMEASGEVTEDTLRSGIIPKNVITRSLGPNPSVQVDLEGPFPLRRGDVFLLCSDGLSGQVTDEEMGIILQLFDPQESSQLLTDIANLRGGPDNITVVIATISDEEIETHVSNGKSYPIERGTNVSAPMPIPLLVIGAIGLLAALVMLFLKIIPLAVVAAVLGVAAFVTAFARSASQSVRTDSTGDQYGKGPHRKYTCRPDQKFSDQLAGLIHALRDAARDNGWQIHWDEFANLFDQARGFEKSKNYADAIRNYGKILSGMMQQIRKQRDAEGDSVHD